MKNNITTFPSTTYHETVFGMQFQVLERANMQYTLEALTRLLDNMHTNACTYFTRLHKDTQHNTKIAFNNQDFSVFGVGTT